MAPALIKNSVPLKVYPGRPRPAELAEGCVLTIGAFDGIHLGHQRLIEQLKEHGQRLRLPSAVLTFFPDPAQFFGSTRVAALMSWREKMLSLSKTEVDALVCLRFDRRVSEMGAEEFVSELLVRQLGVKFLMIGDDFRFGLKREGDYDLLVKLGEQYGFKVAQSSTHKIQGVRVSSTLIRESLAAVDLAKAEQLLGRAYQISGKVIRGEKLGKTLGYPTANVAVRRRRVALQGVFVVVAELENGERIPAVATLGSKPVLSSLQESLLQEPVLQEPVLKEPVLKVHLLDYSGDLYGQRLRVDFQKWLRDEQNFDGPEQLKSATALDVERARECFSDRPFI